MGLFKNNKKVGLFSDVIRCDEPSYLIWKWRPDGKELGEHKRENAIRWGSSLRVKDGEVAVFVYRQSVGTVQDFILGPFDSKLRTSNLPLISGIIGAFVGGDTPFQAEVYFINLAGIIQTRFAVPYFDVCDSRYPDFAVPIAVRGTISFRIADCREFIKMHRLVNFSQDDFSSQIKDSVSRYVKDAIANAPIKYNIPVIQIESKISAINDAVQLEISSRLKENFGVAVSGFDIGTIDVDKSCSAYRQLMSITKDVTAATIIGQTAANIENYAESLRIQREESQYSMHKQTQSANIGAFQIEKQAEVGVAGAQALGQIGANNAGGVDLGGGGFNPAAMMTSMAIGGAVGQNIATIMNGAMPGCSSVSTPPPIPTIVYNVAKDGKPTGPFLIEKLSEMAVSGEITSETLVWTQGMQSWEKAGNIPELKDLFPPPLL